MSLKHRSLLLLALLFITFTVLNLTGHIYISKHLFTSGKIDTFVISSSIMSRLIEEKGDRECYQVMSDRRLFEYMPVAIARVYKDNTFDYLCGTSTDTGLVRYALAQISGGYKFFHYEKDYIGVMKDSEGASGTRYIIIFDYEKDLQVFKQIRKTIIIFDIILFLTMGVVVYLLARRLYLKPFEYLKERLSYAPLNDEFLKENLSSGDELLQILSSVASLIRNLKNEKEELMKTNEELKKAQEDLVRSERLSTIGKTAASIAHEVGTPLGTVRGYIDIVDKGLKINRTENISEYLKKMDNEILRISNILKGLLDYARPPKFNITSESVNALIDDVISFLMMQRLFQDMKIHLEGKTELRAEMDKDRMKQVLINILMNSRDATNGRGNVWLNIGADKRWVVIAVRDDGSGIRESDRDKIFEPFYTTKPSGQGSGLGLAIVKRLVDSMNGKIEFDSVYGKGTEFRIYLRRSE